MAAPYLPGPDEEFQSTSFMTNRGVAKLASYLREGKHLKITHVAVGDGNGSIWVPEHSDTKIIHEVWRGPAQLTGDPNNPNIVIATSVIPYNVGGFAVRELGVFDEDGELIAVCNMPAWPKIKAVNGIQNDMMVGMMFALSTEGVIELTYDPNVITATIFDIQNHNVNIEAHQDIRQQIVTLTNTVNNNMLALDVDGGPF